MKERISILACGWLGRPLAEFLVSAGYNVKGSTTSSQKIDELKSAGIIPFFVSISEKTIDGEIDDFLQSEILIINIPPKRRPDIVEFYSRQFNLLLLQIEKSPIKKVLFVSTTSVYPNLNGTINENTFPKPDKPSGIATLNAEKVLQGNSSFKTTILRFAGLIGPGRNPGRFLAGKKDVSGADSPINLIHLDDCIGIVYSIITKNAWGEIYNGCAPDHPLRRDFYTNAASKSGLIPPVFKDADQENFKIVDGSKVNRVLGYQYKHVDLTNLQHFDN